MKKVLVLMLAMVMVISLLAGCAPKEPVVETPVETPETPVEVNDTPLVVGYAAFSQKFSPFFATTAYDMDAVTMTQLSLLTTDRVGESYITLSTVRTWALREQIMSTRELQTSR